MFNPGNKGVSGTDEGTSTSRPKKLIEVNGIIPLRTAGASKKAAEGMYTQTHTQDRRQRMDAGHYM